MALVNVLKGTNQDFTTSWVDYGSEINSDGHGNLSIWLDLDINDSLNARLRIVGKHATNGADEYPIGTGLMEMIGSSYIDNGDHIEFDVDIDKKILIIIKLNHIIPYIQVQIQAGTVGSTAGRMLPSKCIQW